MPPTTLSIKYRPLRIGMLVDAGDVEGVVASAGINTLLWGGIYNPIIPVKPGDKTASDLIRDTGIDVIKAVNPSTHIEEVANRFPYLREMDGNFREFFYEEWRSKKKLRFLDSMNIVEYYWNRDLKHTKDGEKTNCALVKWEADDSLANVFALQFGFFPSDLDLKADHEHAYLNGLRASKVEIGLGEELDDTVLGKMCPITATYSELTGSSRWGPDPGFYLGTPDSFDDLVNFWNLRVQGCRLLYIPTSDRDRYASAIQAHVSALDKQQARSPHVDDPIVIYHRGRAEEEVEEFRQSIESSRRVLIQDRSDRYVGRPSHHYFDSDRAHAHVEQRETSYTVTVELPQMKFLSEDSRRRDRQHLAVAISASGEYNYPNHTLRIPSLPALNEFYSREIGMGPWDLRTEDDAFAKVISTTDSSLYLTPIHYKHLIQRLFQEAGIRAETSQPGRLTERVIERFEDIDGARVLKVRGVRELLQKLKPQDSVTWSRAKQVIWTTGNFGDFEDLYIEPRETPKLTPEAVLDFLLRKEIFRAGIELKCSSCHLPNWCSLASIDDHWKCEYCGAEAITSVQLRHRGDWRFRKSGLFARDNNQEGAIPVILTLYAFLRVLDFGDFVYSTNLELSSPKCETDLCVLQYRSGQSTEIAIGECKSEGGEITQDDVAKLSKVREKLQAAGLECYVVFSKTADAFSDQELALFNGMVDDGIPVVLLLNKELEPYHPYLFDKDELPEQYCHSIGDMATNSIHRYLGRQFSSPSKILIY